MLFLPPLLLGLIVRKSSSVHVNSTTINSNDNFPSDWKKICLETDTILKNDTCFDIAARSGILVSSLEDWNPGLDCHGLRVGKNLCVHRYISTASSSSSSPEDLETAEEPYRPSFIDPSLCLKQWIIGPKDTCSKIVSVTGIPLEKIQTINSGSMAGFNCSNLVIGSAVCLGSMDDEGPQHSLALLKKRDRHHHWYRHQSPKKKWSWKRPTIQPYRPRKSQSSQSQTSHSDEGALAETNQARQEVGVAPLSWDTTLATNAKQYSQYLADKGCPLIHSHEKGQGENLYASYGSSSNSLRQAVKLWLREKWEQGQGKLNHFTQVVWSGTKKMGCAKGVNTNQNCEVVTCRYDPPGNVMGHRPY